MRREDKKEGRVKLKELGKNERRKEKARDIWEGRKEKESNDDQLWNVTD